MKLLENAHPELLAFGTETFTSDTELYPKGWQALEGRGPEQGLAPDAVMAAVIDAEAIMPFAQAMQGASSDAARVIGELGNTPDNRLAILTAQGALDEYAGEFYNPETGRPNHTAATLAKFTTWLIPYLQSAKKLGFSPKQMRDVVQTHALNLAPSLESIYALMFDQSRADGSVSIGWGAAERGLFLERVVPALMGDKVKGPYLDAWKKLNGDPAVFESIWRERGRLMEEVIPQFEAQAAQEAGPWGAEVMQSYLDQNRIDISVQELLEIMEARATALRNMRAPMNAASQGVEAPFSALLTDEAVLAEAHNMSDYFAQHLLGGENPILVNHSGKEWSPIIRIMANTDQPSFAITSPSGVEFRPGGAVYKGREATARVNHLHELLHWYQMKHASKAAQARRSVLGQESGAAMVEQWAAERFLRERANHPRIVQQMLRKQLTGTVLGIQALKWHLGETGSTDQVVGSLRAAGYPQAIAERQAASMSSSPWGKAAYALRGAMVDDFIVNLHGGDVNAAMNHYAKMTDATQPVHVMQLLERPSAGVNFVKPFEVSLAENL